MSIIEKAMSKAEQERSKNLAQKNIKESSDLNSVNEQTVDSKLSTVQDNFPEKDRAVNNLSNETQINQNEVSNLNETSNLDKACGLSEDKVSGANTVKLNVAPELVMANENALSEGGSYRILKGHIIALRKSQPDKSIFMVTSAMKNEGKSVVSTNLACALATEFDTTVLLIDVDLRGATCHKLFGLEPSKGLSDCLLNNVPITECLIHTGIGRLSFLPAGNVIENTAELVTSQKMQDFLAEVKSRYPDRIIILDSLPLLPFAESRALSRMADGVMLVVRENVTYKRHLENALQHLQDVPLLGIVYNAATTIGADKEIYNLSSYAYGY